jgi:ACT domain-containing protein
MPDEVRRRHLLISVALPDRPGALGAVASRIGALGTDITDIHFGDRAQGKVEITFHLDLPSPPARTRARARARARVDLDELLLVEMREVDGVTVTSQTEASCCPRR